MGLQWRRFFPFALLAFFIFHGFCYSEKAPYNTFVKEATSAPPISYYDYIIVGGGTAGCPLAATLSEDAVVLVLERGGSPYTNPNDLGNFATTLSDTSPTSPSQQFISEDGVFNARARVLGGGSVLNAGFYTRAGENYTKEACWSEDLVKHSYEWVEKKVAFEPPMLQWQSAVRDGLIEVGVLPYNGFTYDHIYGTKVGGTIFDSDGHRHTAADLLEYADPQKITVYLHATVQKILFTTNERPRPKAHCVIFEDASGGTHRACLIKSSVKSEIILSAGAIGSPQLLMLSGIGPANQLQTHGIDVVVEQPLVGQGMSDNPMNALFIPSPQPVEVSLIQVVGITRFDSYIESASGLSFAYSWAQRLSAYYGWFTNQVFSGRQPSMVTPEAMVSALETVQSYINSNGTVRAGVILEKIMGPISTGHLDLLTTNANDNPSVTFNYFQDPQDLKRCVQGMQTIIEVVNSKALSKFRYSDMPVQGLINLMVNVPTNLRPRHVSASISLEQFCTDTVMTIWHYHGGCQVGRVVDNDYKVVGVDALRVVDGSTFLNSPGTNPQATVMMLGRYVGLRILQERKRLPAGKK
ncbi:protein HOTHEAD-like [Pistacia vera]|uniref:protein HOTHEAD-like n=1 Tax=Pistacia vera TaxID=55513 RepID=UPI001262BACE|nr:protein HOTHEAD-like [Pistacia vera]